jgi:hypothetical protein
VPISFFFDGLPALANGDDTASRRAIEFLCTREGAAMVEALSRVPPKLLSRCTFARMIGVSCASVVPSTWKLRALPPRSARRH